MRRRTSEERGGVVVKDLALLGGRESEPPVVIDSVRRGIHGIV
jgi:hypothetical protein